VNWTEEQFAEYMARLRRGETVVISEDAAPVADVSEAFIEGECTKILEEDDWRAWRTDPVSDHNRGKGFGELGMADHLYIRYTPMAAVREWRFVATAPAQVMWIEFKRPGEKPKKHQTLWHIKERARGALTLIAGEDFPASVEGFRQWYAGSGLARRIA
jgi:antitoxin (DNA-binding transcriptional repressor) of toxin-antitoxin stability system